MNEREETLRYRIAKGFPADAITSAIELCNDFLIPRGDFEEAEFLLLEKIGLQTLKEGFILELTLGELYVKIQEIPRAKRFLEVAVKSGIESIRTQAATVLEGLA